MWGNVCGIAKFTFVTLYILLMIDPCFVNCEPLCLCVLRVQIRQEVAFVAAGSRSGESAAHSSDIANVKFKADCNSTVTSQPICHTDT